MPAALSSGSSRRSEALAVRFEGVEVDDGERQRVTAHGAAQSLPLRASIARRHRLVALFARVRA